MINASANLLAISPEIREQFLGWRVCQRYRIERGYEFAEAEVKARAAYLANDSSRSRDCARCRDSAPDGGDPMSIRKSIHAGCAAGCGLFIFIPPHALDTFCALAAALNVFLMCIGDK